MSSTVAPYSRASLPTRQLGRTDMQITLVGFGAWAIGGPDWVAGWGDQDDGASVAAIRRAIEKGINWIDTAAVYGLGHSEAVVRRALADFAAADRPLIFTKGGLVWDESNRTLAPRRVGDPASLRREVEQSLTRLGVERIDLYQMHWPAQDETPLEAYWQTFVDLKHSGKVRAIGLSNHDASQLAIAEAIGHVDSLQPPFSMIRRDAADAELPWAAAHGTGVICYSPMQSGLLTGAFDAARAAKLPANDWRSRSPNFTGEGLTRNLALVEALRPIARRRGISVGALAIAWTLAWQGVTAAIVGARKPEQIDDWIDAGSVQLTADDLHEITAALQSSGAGTGPLHPTGL